ncbi:MAG: Ribosomal RNA large subunit methyltransferase E [Promethearchaeota archaeon]|nr:MAG: Ribosomal RNA large subunit methyltransferase E [Candidatus Lokiarchaeota archaeon]
MTDNKFSKHKQDPHYIKAKKAGYRARSAYKLLDIDKKYNIFKRAFYILDLGSAPGSWLQVAYERAQKNIIKYKDKFYHRDHVRIMGVDTKHITPLEDVKTIKMDFTDASFKEELLLFFHEEKIDLILSDASIKKSGHHFSDHLRQITLCYQVLEIAKEFLRTKGSLVLKIFQGTDMNRLKKDLQKYFNFVKAYKPKASKKKSNEIFLICLRKYDNKEI